MNYLAKGKIWEFIAIYNLLKIRTSTYLVLKSVFTFGLMYSKHNPLFFEKFHFLKMAICIWIKIHIGIKQVEFIQTLDKPLNLTLKYKTKAMNVI